MNTILHCKYRVRVHGLASLAFAATLLTFGGAWAEEPAQLRIGAWNIEWLGNPGSRSGIAKNIAQSPEDLAAYIDAAEVSVLALAEIGDNDDDEMLSNDTLDAVVEILNEGGDAAWTYLIFPKDRTNSRDQCIGVAWDQKTARLVGNPIRLPIDTADPDYRLWDRTPYALQLSFGEGRTDIVVVPLHMKSNVGGSARTRKQRAREAARLVEVLDVLYSHFQDEDVVILGDTNVLSRSEPAIKTFRRAGYNDLNETDEPTTFRGPAPFDRIFTRGGQSEFVSTAQERIELEGLSPDDHKQRLSDHYMVVSSIQVLPDDDGIEKPAVLVGPIGERAPFEGQLLEVEAEAARSRAAPPLVAATDVPEGADIQKLRHRIEQLEAFVRELQQELTGHKKQ